MLPNLIIIGAEKCGTSSLHYYLSLHPEIFMSELKELNYFNEGGHGNKKGLKWYKEQFKGNFKIFGEASPHYTHYPFEQGVPHRMKALIPDAKLIYIVRDPIERMVSSYMDRLRGCNETRDINKALLDIEGSEFFSMSQYYMQIEQFLEFYPKRKILVLDAKDLKDDRLNTMKKVFQYLEVDESFESKKFKELKNVSEGKIQVKKPRRHLRYYLSDKPFARFLRQLTPESKRKEIEEKCAEGKEVEVPKLSGMTRAKIIDALYEDINKLKRFTGRDFEHWSI